MFLIPNVSLVDAKNMWCHRIGDELLWFGTHLSYKTSS